MFSYLYKTTIRDIAIIESLFATGIRVTELCSLKMHDINLDTGEICIKGKGDKERLLYLNDEVKKRLKECMSIFNNEMKNCNNFFINRLKKGISPQSVRYMVKKYAKIAKITKHVTPHVFRHSFASLLLNEGVDLRYIQKCLGHASITTTQIYSHVNCAKQREILTIKHPRRHILIY